MSEALRCVLCGRFLSPKASHTYQPPTPYGYLEPADPLPVCEECYWVGIPSEIADEHDGGSER
jgi:hypothetical protein